MEDLKTQKSFRKNLENDLKKTQKRNLKRLTKMTHGKTQKRFKNLKN